ncbi:hypothetical protein BFW91_01275 [Pseudomonas fluorescens]|nr:hypothetical protein BFW91_01275 [Pseudomonas fluorescens]
MGYYGDTINLHGAGMTKEEKLQHFGWLLVDLIVDLSVAAVVYRDYLQHEAIPKNGPMFHGVSRMCKFSVIIALCKLHDALNDNGLAISSFPDELRAEIKTFRRYVAEKSLFTIRSKFAAHNFDDFDNYTYDDGNRMFTELVGSTLGENTAFFEFINPADHKNSVGTMSHFVTALKDHVKTLVDLPPRVSAQ